MRRAISLVRLGMPPLPRGDSRQTLSFPLRVSLVNHIPSASIHSSHTPLSRRQPQQPQAKEPTHRAPPQHPSSKIHVNDTQHQEYYANDQQYDDTVEEAQDVHEINIVGGGPGHKGRKINMKDLIVEITPVNFEPMVVQNDVPVLVLCYSPYKPDCQTIRSKLEDQARQYSGSLRLASINLETMPDLAQQLGIHTVPTVFCFSRGRALERFTGLVSDKTLNERVANLLRAFAAPTITELTAAAETALQNNDIKTAVEKYNRLATEKTLKAESFGLSGLAIVALQQKDLPLAQALVKNIKDNHAHDIGLVPLVKQAVSSVELAVQSAPSADLHGMEHHVQQNPQDLQGRYDLATAYFSSGQHERAVHEALECLKRDKTWNEEAARKLLIKIFEALGPDSEITRLGRRRFSSLWFV